MKRLLFIIILFFSIPLVYSQVVFSDDVLSSKRIHSTSSVYFGSSSNYGSQISIGASNPANYSTQSVVSSYHASGSSYSSNIYTPFTAQAPAAVVRRSDDDGDFDDEPSITPTDPGDPMPIGNGLVVCLLLLVMYSIKCYYYEK